MRDELTALRQRILDRKALAEAATPGPWGIDGHWVLTEAHPDWDVPEVARCFRHFDNRFIADRDPAAVIAECDADLALLDFLTAPTIIRASVTPQALANLEARYPVKGETP
jgi:hypothetical protein